MYQQLLETSVEEGIKILNRIKAPLEAVAESPDAQQWMQQIGKSKSADWRSLLKATSAVNNLFSLSIV